MRNWMGVLCLVVFLAGCSGKTSTGPKDETVNWKIYTNSDKGFSIQYPSDWFGIEDGYIYGIYGPNADLASISIHYYSSLNDLPLNPVTSKPYEYFNQYISDSHFFKNQKQISFSDGGYAELAIYVPSPSTHVMLVGGNGHFYEVGYQPRYDQTLDRLEKIVLTFKFTK